MRLTPPDELVPVDELAIDLPDDDLARQLIDALRAAAKRADEAAA